MASCTDPSMATTSAAGSALRMQASRSRAVKGSSSRMTIFIGKDVYAYGKLPLIGFHMDGIARQRLIPLTQMDETHPGRLHGVFPFLQIVEHTDRPVSVNDPDRQRPFPRQHIVFYRILDQQLQAEYR